MEERLLFMILLTPVRQAVKSSMSVYFDIGEFAKLFLLINVLLAFKICKERKELKWFELSLVWALAIQIIAKIIALYKGNNLPLLHLYTMIEFVLISLFYKEILFNKLKIGQYFYYFIGLIVLIIVGNSIFIEPLRGFNSNAKGLTQLIIISYSIIYFFNRLSIDVSKKNLILNRINAAILLYYSGSLFIFVFAKILVKKSSILNNYFWDFNALLYLVFQILILIATWRLVFPKSAEIKSED